MHQSVPVKIIIERMFVSRGHHDTETICSRSPPDFVMTKKQNISNSQSKSKIVTLIIYLPVIEWEASTIPSRLNTL